MGLDQMKEPKKTHRVNVTMEVWIPEWDEPLSVKQILSEAEEEAIILGEIKHSEYIGIL